MKQTRGVFKYGAKAWGREKVHSPEASPTKRPRTKQDPSANALATQPGPGTLPKRRLELPAHDVSNGVLHPVVKRVKRESTTQLLHPILGSIDEQDVVERSSSDSA